MKQRSSQNSVDGFVLRRRPATSESSPRLGLDNLEVPKRFVDDSPKRAEELPQPKVEERDLSDSDKSGIDAGLAAIDQENQPAKKRRRLSKKSVKRILIGLAILIALIGAFIGIRAFIAGSRVFEGSLFDLFGQGKALQMDQNGRSNIVVFGNSEDSAAHMAEGAGTELTDSMLIISVDQNKKNAVMFSIPRDLWVKYGEACQSGFEGRINVAYECGAQGGTDKDGAEKLKDISGEVFGLDIHYYVQVNYTALKDAVNAVNGITVEIDSDDPRGVYDPNFDWQCNFDCELVRHENGPVQLNGEEALALARARNAAGGYGLGGGNFDREQYQQKILIALKDKAASAGTLANPAAITGLIDSLGNNVKTDFETGEVKTLINLAQEIGNDDIKRLNLIDEENPVLTTGSYLGQSIVQPLNGTLYDYSEIQQYIRSELSNDQSAGESATIDVRNGTDTPGVAGQKTEELEEQGFNVVFTGDAPTAEYGVAQVYDLSPGQNPETAQRLERVLGVQTISGTPPVGVQSQADFVIIIGSNGVN